MKYFLTILVTCFILTGCEPSHYHQERTPPLTEFGEITSLNYVPRRHSSSVAPGFDHGGMTISVVSTDFPEVWAVTIKCDRHNTNFAMESKELFNKVKIGDKVKLVYEEDVSWDDRDRANTWKVNDVHTIKIIFDDDTVLNRK